MEINVNKGANWTFNQFLAVDQKQGVPWQIGKTEAISSAMTKIEMTKSKKPKVTSSNHIFVECFSQFSFDSEMYT